MGSKTVTLYSDSQVVLHWIKNENKTWKKYVQNRIEQIRQLTDINDWQYIPSSENPADILSRGCSLKELKDKSLWWTGPLEESDSEEPALVEDAKDKELINKSEEISCCLSLSSRVKPVLELNRFSSWLRAVRVLVQVIRFVKLCRKETLCTASISVEEFKNAEIKLIYNYQRVYFQAEMQNVKANQSIQPKSSIYQLNPVAFEDGLLRVNTRLKNSLLSVDEIYPLIIPGDRDLERLLIMHFHIKLLHAGIATTLNEIRKRYWVCQGRRRVKSFIKSCNLCKRRSAIPHQERWGDLPKERVDTENISAFNFVGVDFFGPISAQHGKVYVLLITCLQVRAVHLETVLSLETSEFIAAFSRFIARRGRPATIYSDNAKTFKGAEATMSSVYGIKWKYIIERAPNKGGCWERLVQSVKKPLRIILRCQCFSLLQLQTWLCKVEYVVNLRPLTYQTENVEDIRPISPHDFLIPIRNNGTLESQKVCRSTILESLLWRDKYFQEFFARWKTEYLKDRISTGRRTSDRNIEVGEVVLVDNDKKREFWPLARITELIIGRDGKVRSLVLKCKGKTIRRGLNRVFFLDFVAGVC